MSFGRRANFLGCDHVLERRHMHDDAAEVEFTSSGDQLPIGHAPAVASGEVRPASDFLFGVAVSAAIPNGAAPPIAPIQGHGGRV